MVVLPVSVAPPIHKTWERLRRSLSTSVFGGFVAVVLVVLILIGFQSVHTQSRISGVSSRCSREYARDFAMRLSHMSLISGRRWRIMDTLFATSLIMW